MKEAGIEASILAPVSSYCGGIIPIWRSLLPAEWYGAVVKHADSQHRGCLFDSSMCHF